MFFSVRRIPGTLSLAATNVVASMVVVDQSRYQQSPVLVGAREFLPWQAWFALLFGSGVALVAAVVLRSLRVLHVAAAVSMGVWLAVVSTMIAAYLFGMIDPLTMSPLAWALYLWMILGQASMILAPVWRPDVLPPLPVDRRVDERQFDGPDRRRVA